MAISNMQHKIEVLQDGFQWGCFAKAPISKGDTLLMLSGTLTKKPSKYSIQLDKDQHLEVPEGIQSTDTENFLWRFLNHKCFPNARVDVPNKRLIALEAIAAGTEICFNYNSTEHALAEPFKCVCNNKHTHIKGYKFTSSEEKEFLRPLLAPYLSSLYLL
jgi:SET domain-containing protein